MASQRKNHRHNLARNIIFLRKKQGHTQTTFAEKLEKAGVYITRSAVSAYEEGRVEPNITTIKNLAKYFNLSIEQLVFGDLEKENNG